MKVALIRKAYTPFGGAERHVDRFLDALLERGHAVRLFTARWQAGPALSADRNRRYVRWLADVMRLEPPSEIRTVVHREELFVWAA